MPANGWFGGSTGIQLDFDWSLSSSMIMPMYLFTTERNINQKLQIKTWEKPSKLKSRTENTPRENHRETHWEKREILTDQNFRKF